MHSTHNDLPEQTRQAMCGLLQANLADAIDLVYHAKQAHWNVRGQNFIGLHEFFDDLHEKAEDYVDTLAERITALGGQAEGTVGAAAKATRLPHYPLGAVTPKEHLTALTASYAAFGKSARAAIDEAAEAGDQGTADAFTAMSREIDKNLWMIEAHLNGQ